MAMDSTSKLVKRIECDHHCYKDWYDYAKVVDNFRSEELDAMMTVDILADCKFKVVDCAFVDELHTYHGAKVRQAEHSYHR